YLARGFNDGGSGIVLAHVLPHQLNVVRIGGVYLVDDHHVGAAQIDLARVVGQLVAGTMRIGDYDLQVGGVEGCVVVAAIPKDEVAFTLRLPQNGFVINAGINHGTVHDVGLILLAL